MQILGKQKRDRLFPILVMVLLGSNALVIVMMLIQAGFLSMIANTEVPALVQLVDGESIATEAVDRSYRTPAVTHRTVKRTMQLLMSWNNRVASPETAEATAEEDNDRAEPQIDEGIQVGDGRVTTATYQAGFMLSEDFRPLFLEALAVLTPREVFRGQAESFLDIKSLTYPIELEDGVYQLDMVANLVIFTGDNPQGQAIPFNKTIFVRAVEPLEDPLPEGSSPLQSAIYQQRLSGLEISEIRDLAIQDLAR